MFTVTVIIEIIKNEALEYFEILIRKEVQEFKEELGKSRTEMTKRFSIITTPDIIKIPIKKI